MHGDFSRWTHNVGNHYVAVLEQQGRVRLDADFNEYVAIREHLRRTLIRDLIWPTGVPLAGDDGAPAVADDFKVVPEVDEAGAPKLTITRGRMYVEGVLCELESDLVYDQQEGYAFADSGELRFEDVEGDTLSVLVYADVWRRHISAVENPELRDPALGGPDTTTRLETICQIKVRTILDGDTSCSAPLPASTTARGGRMKAFYDAPAEEDDPCIVAPGGGYRGLENRLYRVEIHQAGGLEGDGVAQFKWSRDNGTVAYRIDEIRQSSGGSYDSVKVAELGRDAVLALREGDWVEIVTDETDLAGTAGTLVQITDDPDPDTLILSVSSDLAAHKDQSNPRLRRWDGVMKPADGAVGFLEVSSAAQELEDGIKVAFSAEDGGTFRVGDYWFFPARTNDQRDVLLDEAPPHGIHHHYARLAVVTWTMDEGGDWQVANDGEVACDCRRMIAPLTSQITLLYVSGDGQEMMPDATGDLQLCDPLQVRVLNAGSPVPGAKVRFRITDPEGEGTLSATGSDEAGTGLVVETDDNGLAACRWHLSPDVAHLCQTVRATLVRCPDTDIDHATVEFNARLRIADDVANQSTCPIIADHATVQSALDRLCDNAALYIVGGDGQSASPGEELCQPLEVRFANGRHPVEGIEIGFEIEAGTGGELTDAAGSGATGTDIRVRTDEVGLASVRWRLEGARGPRCQRVRATVVDPGVSPPDVPPVHFNAEQILITGGAAERCLTVGAGGQFNDLRSALEHVRRQGIPDICLCLMPGEILVDDELLIEAIRDGEPMHVRISGCGEATRILMRRRAQIGVRSLTAFTLRDLVIESESSEDPIRIKNTRRVTVQNCMLSQTNQLRRILMTIAEAESILVENCELECYYDYWSEPCPFCVGSIDRLRFPEVPLPGRPDAYASAMAQIAEILAEADTATRAEFAGKWEEFLREQRADDREILAPSIALIGRFDRIPNELGMSGLEAAVWRLARGVAIAFVDAGADVTVRDSRVVGDVHFHGVRQHLSDEDARRLGKIVEKDRDQVPTTNRTLRICDNALTRLTLDDSLMADDRLPEPFRGLFLLCQCTGNRFDGLRSQMLARHGNISSNYFGPYGTLGNEGLIAASASATVVGNRGQQETLIIVPQRNESVANMSISIQGF